MVQNVCDKRGVVDTHFRQPHLVSSPKASTCAVLFSNSGHIAHACVTPEALVCMQVGFFEVIALPLFKSLVTVTPGAQAMLNAANVNYCKWRSYTNAA